MSTIQNGDIAPARTQPVSLPDVSRPEFAENTGAGHTLQPDVRPERLTYPKGTTVRKLLIFILLVGAGLAGIGLWAVYPRAYSLTENQLQFTHVQKGTLRDAVSATGRIEPPDIVAVPCEVPGTLTAFFARPNDTVAAGAVLAQLDDHKAKLEVEEAESGVEAARAALAQAVALKKGADLALDYQKEIDKQGGFRSERDKAQVQVEAAQAGVGAARQKVGAAEIALKKASDSLDKTRIKAPARGSFIVLDRRGQVGQVVGPQTPPLFLLAADLKTLEVHTQVAEGDIPRVRKGLAASFTVSAFTEEDIEFRGVVKEIRPTALNTQGAVYYDTVVEVPNQQDPASGEWRLRPGMTASVDIIRREHKNVWKVPSTALNFQMDEAYWTEAARQHVSAFRQRPDASDWQPLWIWDKAKPWPVFVRLGGVNASGEPGLKDSEFNEILEWEPGREPGPGETPRIIIVAPPARAPGFFDQPVNIKVS